MKLLDDVLFGEHGILVDGRPLGEAILDVLQKMMEYEMSFENMLTGGYSKLMPFSSKVAYIRGMVKKLDAALLKLY